MSDVPRTRAWQCPLIERRAFCDVSQHLYRCQEPIQSHHDLISRRETVEWIREHVQLFSNAPQASENTDYYRWMEAYLKKLAHLLESAHDD